MKHVKFYLSDLFACGYVRGDVPARQINRESAEFRVDCKGSVMLSDFYGTDLMVFQRAHTTSVLDRIGQAREHGIRTIYEIDDDFFNTPPEFDQAAEFYSRADIQAVITACLRAVDVVTCSTHTLAESIGRRCPDVPKVVVPNALDVEAWDNAYAARQIRPDDGTITIGWMASGSHKIDAPLVMPALERIMNEFPQVRLHLIGWVGWNELPAGMAAHQNRIHAEGWVGIGTLPAAMADFDIGLAPLADNLFNRSKSGIKALQYWALGSPLIASHLDPYDIIQHNDNGLLVEPDAGPDGWYEAIRSLVTDDDRRRIMGARGRKALLDTWDVRKRYRDWERTYTMVLDQKARMNHGRDI